ncbi:hypothetical protein [Ornithinibacillus contaminans]|uniref:hypothetical protein n=1 Tax=Ornithinibacillus contaminans TaxID=694055 RepID=UPI00064E00EB|nr:hypothetical protein [Ornithinibacillus contaminans]
MKKIISILPFVFLFFFVSGNFVSAHKSISDGNATGSNYSPYDVSSESWNERWNIKGTKDGNDAGGKNLMYDIYSGQSSNQYKKKWQIQNSSKFGGGSQPYLVFWGWSAIAGYHHHDRNNQATYILAYNPKTGQEKMYKTEMSSLSATKDLEYNKQSNDPKDIWNKCSSTTFKKSNLDCNMSYEYVGFKAWLPLTELFPNGTINADWFLYIVKNVEGYVVYDELRVPFNFNELDYNFGKVSLSSGVNANRLTMIGNPVLKRTTPRGLNNRGYFTLGATYNRTSQDESAGTSIWYGVKDGSYTSWTSSAYWRFGGSQANLSYQKDTKKCPDGTTVYADQSCTVNVTIYHKDANSGETLRTDKKKATVGKKYSFSAEKNGVFKDSKNRPYVSVPANATESGTTPNGNITITFNYKVALENPSKIVELDGATEGKASGEFNWNLTKSTADSTSRLDFRNDLTVEGNHYEIRNISYKTESPGVFSKKGNKPQVFFISEPNTLKGKDVAYTFSYEYTNHYKTNYKCIDQQGENCFEWQFVKNTPVWDSKHTKSSTWTTQLPIDHKYGETFTFKNTSSSDLTLIIGRKATVNGTKSTTIDKKVIYENFSVDNLSTSLITQSWKPIDEAIQYSSDLSNPFYILPQQLYYFVADIDDNLKGKYKNETTFNFTDYMIPLKIASQSDKQITFKSADNFYLTKNAGFLFSLADSISNMNEIEQHAKEEYEAYTDTKYDDEVLTTPSEGSRYYLNIDGNSTQRPNTWYADDVLIGKLGLSDVVFHLDKDLKFGQYLLGNPLDNPVLNEQQETVENVEYTNSIEISSEQINEIKEIASNRTPLLHGFRSTDIQEKYNQLKVILPSFE